MGQGISGEMLMQHSFSSSESGASFEKSVVLYRVYHKYNKKINLIAAN